MQGQRSSISALPENISFDHGSMSSDTGIDPQLSWNSMQANGQNRLPDYRISSGETNIPYLQHIRGEGRNAEWSLGESSSSASQRGSQNERKPEQAWSSRSRAAFALREQQYELPNILSLDNADINSSSNHTTNNSFLLPNSGSDTLPQDLNMSSEFGVQVDDDCQVIERPAAYVSVGSSNEQMRSVGSSSVPFSGPSGCSGYVMDESEGRPDCSLDGRRMSCKRKALEGHMGQSSGVGSSNSFRSAERNQWHTLPPPQLAVSNVSMPMPIENDLVINNRSAQANPRLRLGVGGAVSADHFSLIAPSGNVSISDRNFHMHVNGLHQQDPMADNSFTTEGNGNAEVQPSRHAPRLVLRNRVFELNPSPAVENINLHRQPVLLPVPSVRRNHPSRWSGASSTRASSSSAPAISEESNSALYEDPTSRNIPRSFSEHPVFISANEMGNTSQDPVSWNSTGVNPGTGNVAPAPRMGPSTGASSSPPGWSRRSCPQYPRRLSEFVRRSLLSSAGTEPGGPSSNHAAQSSSSAASQEMAIPSGPENHRHRAPSSRAALLDRHFGGSFGIPYSLRTLAASSEGRSGIMSEQIRHVLDLMRRGEGLRLEDVMMLDHPVFFGMADIHDRHRDMRMDVDNMSYEELLALEERIGNVCTGLKEETIMSRLRQQKYAATKLIGELETEPCSICREEYNGGEDVGVLECGHDFHTCCIKQWLMVKNLCPICKAVGLTT